MKLNDSEPKNYKVSILLMQKKSNKKEKSKIDLLKLKYSKTSIKSKKIFNQLLLKKINKPLNLFASNNNNTKLLENNKSIPESFRNIQVQTTLSSTNKRFKTPYQILKLKTKMLKDIFDYSKNSHQDSYIQKEINKKGIDIKPYTAYKKEKNNKILLSPQINKLNLNRINIENIKDNNSSIKKKLFKKNKTFHYNISPRLLSSNNKEKYTSFYSIKNKTKIDLLKTKNIFDMKSKKPFKPNCYYNKLNLDKLKNILKKYSYNGFSKNFP